MTKLEQLSAAATQGMMDIAAGANCHCFDGRLRVGGKCIGFVAGDQTEDDDGEFHIIADADGQFIAELWNAYRTGQLVAVQPDDATVERVAVGLAKALYGPDYDPFTSPEMYDFCEQLAKAAIAALAAKGEL